ncbi:hypothetical protein Dimus_006245, partial [Dionaea muscipula]
STRCDVATCAWMRKSQPALKTTNAAAVVLFCGCCPLQLTPLQPLECAQPRAVAAACALPGVARRPAKAAALAAAARLRSRAARALTGRSKIAAAVRDAAAPSLPFAAQIARVAPSASLRCRTAARTCCDLIARGRQSLPSSSPSS